VAIVEDVDIVPCFGQFQKIKKPVFAKVGLKRLIVYNAEELDM
jgi:hypothetical protein